MPQTSVSDNPAVAYPGMLGDSGPKAVDSFINGEASAEIAFGTMLAQGTLDNEALLFDGATDVPVGIVLHSHAYNKDNELGTAGLKPEVTMNALHKGRVWVVIDENVTPASTVRLRHTTAGGGKGTFRASASANATVNLSMCARWIGTHLAATGYGLLEIDLTNRSQITADT